MKALSLFLLSSLLLVAELARAAVIIDIDGSVEQLLAVAALLKPNGAVAVDSLRLIVVSANSRGATYAASALRNTQNFLATAKASHVPIVLGELESWRDRTLDARGLRSCRDASFVPLLPLDVIGMKNQTPPPQPWSMYEDSNLFGQAFRFTASSINSVFPFQSIRQGGSSTSSGASAAIQQVVQGVLAGSAVSYERVDYIALTSLTTLATYLNQSDTVSRNKLNLHLYPLANYVNFLADPIAANFTLSVPDVYRKMYLPSLLEPVATFEVGNWQMLMGLRETPTAIKILLDALKAKSLVVARNQGLTPDGFAVGPFGPQRILGAFCAIRSNQKQLLTDTDIGLVSYDPVANTFNVTVLEDITSLDVPAATHLFRTPFPNESGFWTDLGYLLTLDKSWMKGQ